LFYESQFTGLDLPANLAATRAAAGSALALFAAASPEPDSELAGWRLDLKSRPLNDAQTATIEWDCYTLLLILAEAVAHPLESEDAVQQTGKALRILDRAAHLRAPTRAYHLRRAGYLTRQGNSEAALRELAQVEKLQPVNEVDHFLLGDEFHRRK